MRPNIRKATLFTAVLLAFPEHAHAIKVMCVTTVDPAWKESILKDQQKKDRELMKQHLVSNPTENEDKYKSLLKKDDELIEKRSKKINAQNKPRKQPDKRCSNKVKKERDSLVGLRKIVPEHALACMCVNGADQNADDGMAAGSKPSETKPAAKDTRPPCPDNTCVNNPNFQDAPRPGTAPPSSANADPRPPCPDNTCFNNPNYQDAPRPARPPVAPAPAPSQSTCTWPGYWNGSECVGSGL